VTFFVDANVILYAAMDSEYREGCVAVLEAIVDGADGRTSTAALEEVWHIERSGRLGGLDGLTEHAYDIFSPLLAVTDQAFMTAFAMSERSVGRLGTNDRIHVGTCIANGIDAIVTADRGFSAVGSPLSCVDPRDADALHDLLGGR
jgi:predicted nucleic acid-binding protein